MRWFEHAIWWQVYPLGFTGAPVRPVSDGERLLTHRLGHLHNWLDHAQQLGTNGLLLGPVFTSSTHGYDTLDHYTVDPRLGDDSDFDALVAACRERGIVVLLDGVFNHVGDQHPLYRAALEKGPDSEEAKLFRIDWSQNPPRASPAPPAWRSGSRRGCRRRSGGRSAQASRCDAAASSPARRSSGPSTSSRSTSRVRTG